MNRLFQKILIANRGEIAVRIIKTARKLGMSTVAVYAADDSDSLHVKLADEAFLLPGALLSETYLNQEKLVALALQSGADAIHPGYGFLAENAAFAERVESAGIIFIGATPDQIRLMGEKNRANSFVETLGVPVLPGIRGSVDKVLNGSDQLQFPLLVKASAGGGGKGMQIVQQKEDLPAALEQASRQAKEYFGNSDLFVEKYLPRARHVEVQLMGDGRGKVVHFFERDCSMQRRYQKVVEEAPAPGLADETRKSLHEYALTIARASRYRGAGTIEFLVDENQQCWFLEMNTRLQVEHPVTEAITGEDLVAWQLNIAAGNGLLLDQEQLIVNGHAVEVRLCAEDPAHHFVPSSGKVEALMLPKNSRWDGFIEAGNQLSPNYDSLLGKLIVHAPTRSRAIDGLSRALDDLFIGGIKTNQSFLQAVLNRSEFQSVSLHTKFIEEHLSEIIEQNQDKKNKLSELVPAVAFALFHFFGNAENKLGYWRLNPVFQIMVDEVVLDIRMKKQGSRYFIQYKNEPYWAENVVLEDQRISFSLNGDKQVAYLLNSQDSTRIQYKNCWFNLTSKQVLGQVKLERNAERAQGEASGRVIADLFGKVVEVFVEPGDRLLRGQNLLVIESMKTEFTIQSPSDAIVKSIHVSPGKVVQDKELLIEFESN